ncbi:Ppx/GppA phosphatase family protein [Aquiflexum gelatinilyticum]|uniref:Ppx/GppA family phosphatase n=1 Tax=Aquiflexum gelatinilyticum TaxID=2961943 RepID=A0A9X2SXG6_9BACT|nr:Ppx/GppA phosphatase family protein [Aquiflexum gelatinilyticum]MCR9013579.1 Ppx/GppA family phosphatase [Aquiflexum gelatinilyticum]
MNLAAIDIGTNSIHMVIVKVTSGQSYEVLVQEKEMVKLGVGVFANKMLSQRAFDAGIETISRYVQLADEYGVEHIITAATSATREAKNGREFLDRLIQDVGLNPQMISGKEEARLIFLAVRKAIDLKKQNAMVIDIGGGSTEVVIGNKEEVFFKKSLKLGVLRLLDWVGDQGPLNKSKQETLREHVKEVAGKTMKEASLIGFSKVIGTSGTIRTLGEAALEMKDVNIINSVNAEVIKVKDLEKIVDKLLELPADKRTDVKGISENRVDAIHLGGLLLLELLKMADAKEITLSDASLREGLIIDYIEKNGLKLSDLVEGKNIRERSCLLMAMRYETDIEEKKHVSMLALQLFDQLKEIHQMDSDARELLQNACLIFDVGLFVNFQDYHKHAAYLILNGRLRGFNNEERIMLALMARYHRKSGPKKKHEIFGQLESKERTLLKGLVGILRIAVALDKTKNQWVEKVHCELDQENLEIRIFGDATMDLEIWEAQRFSDVLAKYLKRNVTMLKG